MLLSLPKSFRFWSSIGLALGSCFTGFSQQVDLPDGPVGNALYGRAIRPGPRQSADTFSGQITTGLAFYTGTYTSLGAKPLPFNIVGTDPSLGASTTVIPTVIVPIKLIFPNAPSLPLDGTNVVTSTVNSPIFQTADYTVGGTDLGITQFGDALQRGEFFNLPGFSLNYHVLLGTPTVAPTVTVTVPSGSGTEYRLRNGGLLGVVDNTFFDNVIGSLITSYTANELPIFLTDNVFEGPGGVINNCCILGYHSSQGPPIATAKTWIYAAYSEPGTFTGNAILDVQSLSHEVAEWLNDPFVGGFPTGINFIPPAILPGQGGACIINFETGDPLEAPPSVFTQVTNGTTYHLQDEVFLPWYLHTTPSFSVNGWYTLQNSFPTFSTLCGAG